MNAENFNRQAVKLRVLVAPLDWGLGHATRCIPVIKELIINGFEVMIAAEGPTQSLLQAEFSELKFLPLQGYEILYSRQPKLFVFKLIGQFPKIFGRTRYEQRWLKKAVLQYGIDAIISDNRPGLYHRSIPAVYITHQLNIKTGSNFISRIAQKLHYRYINKFSECWIPDAAGKLNLAGDLSHPQNLPKIPLRYLGPLSRFEKKENIEKKIDLLMLLSGPEPQRTIFENKLLAELRNYKGNVLLVRGLPGNLIIATPANSSIQQFNHLSASELNEVIQQSKMVISRSGYTTVMDLVKLKQPAIFVPTPGQTEQEYLGDYLMQQKMFFCVKQDGFALVNAIEQAERFSFDIPVIGETYKDVIKQWAASL